MLMQQFQRGSVMSVYMQQISLCILECKPAGLNQPLAVIIGKSLLTLWAMLAACMLYQYLP